MELIGQRPSGLAIVPERLLDDDTGRLRQTRVAQALDHASEEERRDLEVEDRGAEPLDLQPDPLVGVLLGEVT